MPTNDEALGAENTEEQPEKETDVEEQASEKDAATEKDVIEYSKYQKLLTEKKTVQNKLREFEAARDAERQSILVEQGKYKQLFDEYKTNYEALKAEHTTATERLAKYLEREEQERERLVRMLPKELREEFADATISQIQKLQETIAVKKADSMVQPSAVISKSKEPHQTEERQLTPLELNRKKIASILKAETIYS